MTQIYSTFKRHKNHELKKTFENIKRCTRVFFFLESPELSSFSVILTLLCFQIFLVFILVDGDELLLNTVEIHETLCVFNVVAHWLSVSFQKTVKKRNIKIRKTSAGSR